MELELTQEQTRVYAVWTMIVIALLGFGFLGREMTPRGNVVLTWPEWQILNVERQYQKELNVLRQDMDAMAKLLNKRSDPVRVQIITDAVLAHVQHGLSALDLQRTATSEAAKSLRDWSVGAIQIEEAIDTMNAAKKTLADASLRRVRQ